MRKATTVKPIMWRKPGFHGLSPNTRYLFIYLLTNPNSNLAGLFQCSIDTICLDTGLTRSAAKKSIAELTDAGKVMFDEQQGVLFIVNWLRHNPVASSSLEAGYLNQIRPFEYHDFHQIAVSCLSGEFPDRVSHTPPDRVSHTLKGEGSLNSEERVSPKREAEDVLKWWNNKHGRNISAWDKIRDRVKAGATVEDCRLVIDYWTKKWSGTKWEEYLRPQTLFAPTKFNDYLSDAKEGKITNKENIPTLKPEGINL